MTDAPVLAATAWRTNAEMIADVARLGYLRPGDRILDPTWGRGTWWNTWRPSAIEGGLLIGTDLDPTLSPGTNQEPVDFRDLPYADATFDVVALDPPYKLNGTASAPDVRYGVDTYASVVDRHQLIRDGITEAARVLRELGYLLLKCQDQVNGGRVRWQTLEFTNHAATVGLELSDRLDRLGYRAQPAGRRQVHARRNASTLLILQKAR